jgi:hypothetical protein
MRETVVDVSEIYRRAYSLPAITLANAAMLARDYDLEITGPDGEGRVSALITDPRTRVSGGFDLGDAEEAAAWLAWRDGRS